MTITKQNILLVAVAGLFAIASQLILFSREKVDATVPYIHERVSVDSSGNQGNNSSGASDKAISVNNDGRYVAFASIASNLVSGDTNNKSDIFVRDTQNNTTERVSIHSNGDQFTYESAEPTISADGRYVAFLSREPLPSTGDGTSTNDIMLYDRVNDTVELISKNTSGTIGNSYSAQPDISADGRFIVFTSNASNLTSGDTNGVTDVFVRDRTLNTTTLISKSDSGTMGDYQSGRPSISCDGGVISFASLASNLVAGDTNGQADLFIVDRVAGHRVVNATINGNGSSFTYTDTSCDGTKVVFASNASNLVAGDTNNKTDIFSYKIFFNSFELVSQSTTGLLSNNHSTDYGPSVSSDGRYIAFSSDASNLVAGDTNSTTDIFIRDTENGTTERISMRNSTTETTTYSSRLGMSTDGRYVAFESLDNGLVSGDTNGEFDVFLSQTGFALCSEE